jgi:hypothetical protein
VKEDISKALVSVFTYRVRASSSGLSSSFVGSPQLDNIYVKVHGVFPIPAIAFDGKTPPVPKFDKQGSELDD